MKDRRKKWRINYVMRVENSGRCNERQSKGDTKIK